MVKSKRENNAKSIEKQGKSQSLQEPAKINASTSYELCDTRMTAYGGLLAFIKFLDSVKFNDAFEKNYCSPSRKPVCGCYKMILGFLMLLFIGFARVGQLWLIREDPMVCGILGMQILPAISTFWRYLATLGLNQSNAILNMSAELRMRVWKLCSINYDSVCISVDTTVSTVYGNIEGSRKGHNTKHRGKKGLRPVFLFIEETREYLCGTQRSGTTMTDEEMATLIRDIHKYLPATVKNVLVKGDAEFIGGKTIKACEECGYKYIFANKRCAAVFPNKQWYKWTDYTYNETKYQPMGWEKEVRFVVMRIPEEQRADRQLELFEDQQYMHRVFATNCSGNPHTVIKSYDKRAGIELLIKEAQQEGILAIPSKRFHSNHCFFQLVMLAYNLWRWMKLVAGKEQLTNETPETEKEIGEKIRLLPIVNHTIRIARLKMLFIAAKVTSHEHKVTVKYSEHDVRASELIGFMSFLDTIRNTIRPWDAASAEMVIP